jgi:L-asparaginase
MVVAMALVVPATLFAEDVRVMTSAAFYSAYAELGPEFERVTGHHLITIRGPSMGDSPEAIPNRLARGETADVVILDGGVVDDLTSKGVVRAGSKVVLALSQVGVVVRAGASVPDISSSAALKRTLLAARSIGYSDSGSGTYLSTVLFTKLGIADQVARKSRKVRGPPSGEPVAAVVARGEVDIGFQQVSELMNVPGVTFVGALPADLQPGFTFAGAIPTAASQPDAAAALLRFLASPNASAVKAKHGLAAPLNGNAGGSATAFGQAGSAAQSRKPVVYVLSTGGTISGRGDSSTNLTDYRSGSLLGEQLVAGVPEINAIADVHVEQVANVSSTDIGPTHWLMLAKRIDRIFSDDRSAAGIVITHGTNTLEETAYFLNLTVHHDRPVVLVGSMRPSTAISADGPINLLNGVRTAVAPDARGKGVLVVLNDEINAARDVTKTNTLRVETFRAPELGLLGYVDGDRVSFYRESTRRHTIRSEFDVTNLQQLPAVQIVYSYAGAGTAPLDAAVASGAAGIVIAGTGNGLVSTEELSVLQRVAATDRAQRPVVVRSARVGNGRVTPRATYDAMDVIPADNLNPQKARVLLMLALTRTRDPKAIARMFSEY